MVVIQEALVEKAEMVAIFGAVITLVLSMGAIFAADTLVLSMAEMFAADIQALLTAEMLAADTQALLMGAKLIPTGEFTKKREKLNTTTTMIACKIYNEVFR